MKLIFIIIVTIFLSYFKLYAALEAQFDKSVCIAGNLIRRYNLNQHLYKYCNLSLLDDSVIRVPRKVDAIFRGNPKPRNEILAAKFSLDDYYYFKQTNSLVALIYKIATEYLMKCPPIIYYDSFVKKSDGMILENLFKAFPTTYYHGEINEHYEPVNQNFKLPVDTICRSYILFLSNPSMTRKIIGRQTENRVVVIARSSQWKLKDFLASESSSNIVNLLVIGESLTTTSTRERPYVLYTHNLYADGLGSNTPIVLTSWLKGALSRPHINLFPAKLKNGFSGHRFRVSASNQPPFIFRLTKLGVGGSVTVRWDGIEYRLLQLIGEKLNFSIDITTTPTDIESRNVADAIQLQIANNLVDIGISGIYITQERLTDSDMSVGHSSDCAAFITLASKALPKHRAILGPFQWPVWLALIFVYLGAVFPIVYSDRLTLKHLMGNWGEIENMFWYVFGMFTNAFTFSGKYSWSNSEKTSTRLLIGSYWVFTIIITSCYTGSIIAFVTLPAFPETVDSVQDLLGLFFRVGTLDNGGWEKWFQNSTHEATARLYNKMEFVSSFQEGIGNVTQSFFWNYAFLASRAQLQYLVQSNFTNENLSKRSALHLSEECFALFQTGFLLPRDSVFKVKLNNMILLAQQSGLIKKLNNEVKWSMQRSSDGKFLQAGSSNALSQRVQEERQLTTADTEGMFLLMGIGYIAAVIALISEVVGGITNRCRRILRNARRMSTTWSSSVADDVTRTLAEQQAHELRKQEHQEKLASEQKGFNITRNALRDLFHSYNQPQPNYILRNGRLILEDTAVSLASSMPNSTNSETENPNTPLLNLRIKKKDIVLAEVDVHNGSDISGQEYIESLDLLDKYLTEQSMTLALDHAEETVFADFIHENQTANTTLESCSLILDAAEQTDNKSN